MKKTLCTTASLLSIMAANLAIAAEPATSTTTKTLSVYTTAKDSAQRLTLTDTLSLKPGQQPPETDIAVFVNPEKRFQTFFGMGGAITDASAEVFSTLKPAKKSEFLKAYYDQKTGIG
jgi:glucosylceramidase